MAGLKMKIHVLSHLLLLLFVSGFGFKTALSASDSNETIIQINLRPTYSSVGVYRNGKLDIIADNQGNRITLDCVAFTDTEILIGEAAENQAAQNRQRTIFDINRLIGRKFDDPWVQRYMKITPYTVLNRDGKPYIQVNVKDGDTKVFSPEELSAMVMQKMKGTAEAFLGKEVKRAVIQVPARFDDAKRQAVKDSCRIAALEVEQIINKPTVVLRLIHTNAITRF